MSTSSPYAGNSYPCNGTATYIGKKQPTPLRVEDFENGTWSAPEQELSNVADKQDPEVVLQKYAYLRIDDRVEMEEPEAIITISGETVATAGNLVTISGPSKQGKSAAGSVIIAGSITCLQYDGFEGLEVKQNRNKHAVLHIDTEQSKFKHYKNLLTIKRRTSLSMLPDFLLSYNARQLDLSEYEKTTREIFEAAFRKYGGIHLALIDGIADYIADPNDQLTSIAIVKFFEQLSIEFNTSIICIVHVNPNSDKERGHLGSQLQRKSESVISIKKDEQGDISFIEPKYLRNAGNSDLAVIQFKYDKEKGYHVYYGEKETEKQSDKDRARIEDISKVATAVFGQDSLDYGEAIQKIMVYRNKKERVAKDIFKEMNAHGFIVNGEDKRWRLHVEDFI